MDEIKQSTNRSLTTIENLSNELFYEICDYLDGYYIYKAFSNLNSHFQQLLHSSFLLFKIIYIKWSADSKEMFLNLWNEIHSFHRQQLFSLDISMSSFNNEFFSTSFFIDSSFHRLQSLVLYELKTDILTSILKKLVILPCLFSLYIDMDCEVVDITEIYRLVFTLPVLKYAKFWIGDDDLIVSLPVPINQPFSPIESIIINHCCSFNEISSITSYTPQLRYLKFIHDLDGDPQIQSLSPIILSNLTYVSIRGYDLSFHTFRIFIKALHANIKTLRLITESKDINYLNGQLWEKFIVKYLPKLERFYLEYCEHIGDEDDDDDIFLIYPYEPNQFTSSFWIEKQWLLDTEIEYEYMKYTIRPYKKRWYENDSIEYSQTNLLNISDIHSFERLTTYIKHCFEIGQIYHLEISVPYLSFSLLLLIISVLPELHSIKIHSLSYAAFNETDLEEFLYFCLKFYRKKITKLYLQQMFDINEIDFLTKLLPYLVYFKIGCVYNMNNESGLIEILKDINNPLRLLCFGLPTIDDHLIENLQKMLNNDDELSAVYTIKRIVNHIYIQWK